MKITKAAAGFAIAAAAVFAPTMLTAPAAHAWPWSGCEDTASTIADLQACGETIAYLQQFNPTDTVWVLDHSSKKPQEEILQWQH